MLHNWIKSPANNVKVLVIKIPIVYLSSNEISCLLKKLIFTNGSSKS